MSLGSGAKGAASGALTGAGLGSFVPGVGTAIGAGVGGTIGFIKGLFGGGDDEKDDEKFDTNKTALSTTNALTAHSKKMSGQADDLGGMSAAALMPVLDYFKAVASGDPQALMQATMPERGRVIDQYDSARKAAVMAAPRGGGTTSAIAESYINEANQLSDLTAMARRDGASQLAGLGTNLAGLSLSADQLAAADLDSVIRAVFGQQQIDAQKRGQTMGMLGDVGEAIGTIVAILASKGGGGA